MGMAMKDVRERLSELVKRAAYRGEQITFGPNHGDDVMLVATEKVRRLEADLRELERQITEMRRSGAEPRAFAGLQQELEAGALSSRGETRRQRRVLPNVTPTSSVSREERIRLGAGDNPTSGFRRTRPRA